MVYRCPLKKAKLSSTETVYKKVNCHSNFDVINNDGSIHKLEICLPAVFIM